MEIDSPLRTDVVSALGHLCLGTRLKRLGERMQAGVAQVLSAQGHAVQPAQLPLLMALHKEGPMTVSLLAERLGFAQPGVSRTLAALAGIGLVETAPGGRDRRERQASLTAEAMAQMRQFEQGLFPAVDGAVAGLCGEAGADLLGDLAAIEEALAALPLESRIGARMAKAPQGHVLDNPAWHALTGPQADHALGGALAKRFDPVIGPIAGPRDGGPDAIAALAALAPEEGVLATLLAWPMELPEGIETVRCSPALQMIMDVPPEPFDHPEIEMLEPEDAGEMRALAELTEPGPFAARTHELGTFWGVRDKGRIVAMAGERMRLAGFGEVSAVCVHPDARGRGLGALLTRKAAATVGARGLVPFLHVYADNLPAIATYERVGFRVRSAITITMFRRRAEDFTFWPCI